ncbi:hypothetical protein [Variovorax sp. IB41]|uniref:hypothetical protein n=1 Tax=Variovorax sp. IB41 TaxID=2779370 RepID=UPI0018E8FD03|nr:hypothetical protein [Variovorax sp. IB41]MBJ2159492.1 hypothetical protein [Variovorax sp. IB41]
MKRTVRLPMLGFALVFALAAGVGAHAMTLREFHTLEVKEKKEGKAYASYYLVGVLEGLREASDTARRTGQKPLFCVDGRRLEPSMARSLFQAELKRNAELYEADMPVQLVLSSALQNSFRCAS